MITYIALGSNLGDRGASIDRAGAFLQTLSDDGSFRMAPLIETAPVDCPPGSPPFLNTVAEIRWSGSPFDLLDRLQAWRKTKAVRGFVLSMRRGRSILDIILFGDEQILEPSLCVPHPRASARQFVLEPLVELAPDLIWPGLNCTVGELLAGLKG